MQCLMNLLWPTVADLRSRIAAGAVGGIPSLDAAHGSMVLVDVSGGIPIVNIRFGWRGGFPTSCTFFDEQGNECSIDEVGPWGPHPPSGACWGHSGRQLSVSEVALFEVTARGETERPRQVCVQTSFPRNVGDHYVDTHMKYPKSIALQLGHYRLPLQRTTDTGIDYECLVDLEQHDVNTDARAAHLTLCKSAWGCPSSTLAAASLWLDHVEIWEERRRELSFQEESTYDATDTGPEMMTGSPQEARAVWISRCKSAWAGANASAATSLRKSIIEMCEGCFDAFLEMPDERTPTSEHEENTVEEKQHLSSSPLPLLTPAEYFPWTTVSSETDWSDLWSEIQTPPEHPIWSVTGPPPIPVDHHFNLEVSSLCIGGEAGVAATTIYSFIKQLGGDIYKVNTAKYTMKAELFVWGSPLHVKIRLYQYLSEAVMEFQRRGGDAIALWNFYQAAKEILRAPDTSAPCVEQLYISLGLDMASLPGEGLLAVSYSF